MKAQTLAIALILSTSAYATSLAEVFGSLPSEGACYTRSYSAAHLARNPLQTVKDITVKLTRTSPWTTSEGEFMQVLVHQKKSPRKALRQAMSCFESGGEIICAVDCDGGSMVVNALKDGKLTITNNNLTLKGGCGEDEDETIFLETKTGGDDTFVLNVAPMSTCAKVDFP
jgi:hypothetical protein